MEIADLVSNLIHFLDEVFGDSLEILLSLHSRLRMRYAFHIVVSHLQYTADDIEHIVVIGLSLV